MGENHVHMSSEWDKPSLVVDNGTGTIKFGLSGNSSPQQTQYETDIPLPDGSGFTYAYSPGLTTCVGYPLNHWGNDLKDYYIGAEAMQRRGILKLTYPIDHGVITNWDDMEKIWKHLIDNELRVVVGDDDEAEEDVFGILMTEGIFNPKANRERMIQTIFEVFGARHFYLANQSILAMYGTGRKTGVVVDCGESTMHAVPIHDGYVLAEAVQHNNLGGRDLTNYLARMLQISERPAEAEYMLASLKSDMCYASLNFAEEVDNFSPVSYELPDRSTVPVNDLLIRCPELMFKPNTGMGLHELVHKCAVNTVAGVRADLFSNIVMCGGSSLFRNLPERLEAEVAQLAGQAAKVVAPPERTNLPWIGGSILASLTNISRAWISRDQYEEVGPSIIHQMCDPKRGLPNYSILRDDVQAALDADIERINTETV